MPRRPTKKTPVAQTFGTPVDQGMASQVRLLHLTDRKSRITLRAVWTDPIDGYEDNHLLYDSFDDALREAQKIAGYLRDGLRPHVGRHVRDALKARVVQPRRETARRTFLTAEDEWKVRGFGRKGKGKPGSLKNALYNLEHYAHPLVAEYGADGLPTGRQFSLVQYALEDIDEFTIATWDRSWAQVITRFGAPMSASTRALVLRNITAVLEYARELGWISRNPAKGYKIDLYGVKPRDCFEDQDQFFKVVEYLPDWAKAPVIALAMTGMRYGEGGALLVGAIDTGQHRIFIERNLKPDGTIGTPKSVASEAFVPYHPSLSPIFEKHIASLPRNQPGDRLFPGQRRGQSLNNSSLNRLLKAACERAGLDIRVTCHGLRHSLATWLSANGTPMPVIQEVLRQADIRTTRKYVHVNEKAKATAMKSLTAVPRGVL